MDFSYENGVGFAFLIGLVKVILATANLKSVRAKNMRQVGLYYSCIQGKFVERKGHPIRFVMYLTYMLILAPIFSWISVISAGASWLWFYSKQKLIPEKIKELQYRLGASQLPRDQVVKIATELGAIHGASAIRMRTAIEDATLQDGRESEIELEVDNDENGVTTMRLDRDAARVFFDSHPHDFGSEHKYECEFRIEGTSVENRTISSSVKCIGEETRYEIIDNVVQEVQVRDYYERLSTPIHDPDEIIVDMKKRVEWHSVGNPKVKYFILANASNLSPFEFRKFLQSEKQRIEVGCRALLREIDAAGGEIEETNEGYHVRYKDKDDKTHQEKLDSLFINGAWLDRQISEQEFTYKKSVLIEIDRWVGSTKAIA